jgi:hypothetical protein
LKASEFLLKPTLTRLEEHFLLSQPLREADSAEHLYFIDHRTKSAFSGESLGRSYTLDAIRERCQPEERLIEEEIPSQRLKINL